jgi:hypothetical protein
MQHFASFSPFQPLLLQHQLHPSREALDCVHVLDGPNLALALATLDPRLSILHSFVLVLERART